MTPVQYDYTRYLLAKRTVDDRALNKDVLAAVRSAVAHGQQLRVLELGAGLGTMVARLVESQMMTHADYTLVDHDERSLSGAFEWLSAWARQRGFEQRPSALSLELTAPHLNLTLRFLHRDLNTLAVDNAWTGQVDFLVANAVLDLVHLPMVLPRLIQLLAHEGHFWSSINFDGESIFLPENPADEALMAVYHRSMNQRAHGAGDSKTGRRLFGQLAAAKADVLSAGSSDWVVHARDGKYRDDEAYFLHHIIHTIDTELSRWPEVPVNERTAWVALRHAQIERGELVFIAHQLDFLAQPRVNAE